MKQQRHFGSATPTRDALQTKELIADINRVVQILDSDIAAEEEQARVFDRSRLLSDPRKDVGRAPGQSSGHHRGSQTATCKSSSGSSRASPRAGVKKKAAEMTRRPRVLYVLAIRMTPRRRHYFSGVCRRLRCSIIPRSG
jgi:hypothetical protein